MVHLPRVCRFTISIVCLFFVLCGQGCTREQKEQIEPSEPWRREENATKDHVMTQVHYRPKVENRLEVSLPTSRAKPTGTLSGFSGEVQVNLEQLQYVQGHLRVDLRHLKMDEEQRPVEQKHAPPHPVLSPELETRLLDVPWTQQALNWLSLGANVPSQLRRDSAVFTIESARDLSHPRAEAGALRKNSESGFSQIRVVDATAVGTLTLFNLSVDRTVPIRILFYYRENDVHRDTEPQEIEIQLRGKLGVPLLEYDIRPRDQLGHTISELEPVVGYWVGNTAWITGSLRLEKVAL